MKSEKSKNLDNSIRKKVLLEISQIDKLISEAKPLIILCRQHEPDFIEKSASALLLHSFYNGVENILSIILKHYNELSFLTEKWHRELLETSFIQTDLRTNILDSSIKDQLLEYLAFRHFVRHSYGFQIDWLKMKHLIINLELTWNIVKTGIESFLDQKKTV